MVAISAAGATGSKTTTLVRRVLLAAEAYGADAQLVPLGDLALEVADGRRAEDYQGDTRSLLDSIDSADAVVFGMPVYRATMPGSVKNVLDLVPRGKWDGAAAPLRSKAVAVVATGATPHHFLAIDEIASIMRGFFGAYVVPPGIYACHSDFTDGALTSPAVEALADRTGAALVALARSIRASEALSVMEPQI